MKVAFWSGVSMSDGAPNYVAAIGTMLALICKCEVVLGSSYISNRMLQDCFSSKIKEEGVAHAPYKYLWDSPEYHAALWNMKKNRPGDVLEVPMEGITIIYPPDMDQKAMFYYEVPKTTFYLLDTAGENSAAFQRALDEAEIVVVFLSQDATEIQNFLKRFSSLIPKTLVILEVVQRDNRTSLRKFSSDYGIDIRNIGIIPYDKDYVEACDEGRLEAFLQQGLRQSTKGPQYNFMSKLKNITTLLYERCAYEQRKEGEWQNGIQK